MRTRSARPRSFARFRSTPSPVGERQMLPVQTTSMLTAGPPPAPGPFSIATWCSVRLGSQSAVLPEVPPFDDIPWAGLYIASEWAWRIGALILVPQRRTAASARAWLLLILFWPWPGLVLYLLIGRAYLPRRRLALEKKIDETIRRVELSG